MGYLIGSVLAMVMEAARRTERRPGDLALYLGLPIWYALAAITLGWQARWAAKREGSVTTVQEKIGTRIWFPAVTVAFAAVAGFPHFMEEVNPADLARFVLVLAFTAIVGALGSHWAIRFDDVRIVRSDWFFRAPRVLRWTDVESVDLNARQRVSLRGGRQVIELPPAADGAAKLAREVLERVPERRFSSAGRPREALQSLAFGAGRSAEAAGHDRAVQRGNRIGLAFGAVLAAGVAAWLAYVGASTMPARLVVLPILLSAAGGVIWSWVRGKVEASAGSSRVAAEPGPPE